MSWILIYDDLLMTLSQAFVLLRFVWDQEKRVKNQRNLKNDLCYFRVMWRTCVLFLVVTTCLKRQGKRIRWHKLQIGAEELCNVTIHGI